MSKKHPSIKEQRQLKIGSAKQQPKGHKLYKASLLLCLIASILIVGEGMLFAFVSPPPFGIQLLWTWGGYVDLLLGIIVFLGLVVVAKMRDSKTGRTAAAISIGVSSVISLILFGGGFYAGFILGLIGAFLTATGEQVR